MTSGWRAGAAAAAAGLAVMAASLSGCGLGGEKPRPLTRAQFTPGPSNRTEKPLPQDPLSGADQPGALFNTPHTQGRPEHAGQGGAGGQAGQAGASGETTGAGVDQNGVSRTVQENVIPPGAARPDEVSATGPASPASPAPAPPVPATTGATAGRVAPGASSGQYLTIGGVVMEVNGTPIYANRVLALVEPVLAARAKDLDEQRFRRVASDEITKQVYALRNLELEYAAAERNLDQKDKDLAEALTMQWRKRQEIAAGGSSEVARQRAAARGEDFEDLVRQQFRVFMSQIYYQKKIMPRVQVSASDVRTYYDRNREREFAERSTARFRLIKVDIAKSRGIEAATDKIAGLRSRIVNAGEPFESLARAVNDDPRLLASGGDLGAPIQKGAFAIEPVEQAVWATPVGGVTPVVRAGNALYLAKVEHKTEGKQTEFEDDAVQTQIFERLRTEQFRALRQQVQENLVKDAVIRSDADMVNTAIEMAMQNYTRWAGR
ncbi:MAG TPA: peptidylprolyl isomerase [Tepidisphaeraceae bacterium]|nr:peptidylprolyl isomerase [Tepidisphaeraceae bacterium]